MYPLAHLSIQIDRPADVNTITPIFHSKNPTLSLLPHSRHGFCSDYAKSAYESRVKGKRLKVKGQRKMVKGKRIRVKGKRLKVKGGR
jgi:hypothetical protein